MFGSELFLSSDRNVRSGGMCCNTLALMCSKLYAMIVIESLLCAQLYRMRCLCHLHGTHEIKHTHTQQT